LSIQNIFAILSLRVPARGIKPPPCQEKHSSLLRNYICKKFKKLSHGVNIMKLSGHMFTYTFCKLDQCINISSIFCIAVKRSSLQQRVSIFKQNNFYEIDTWGLYHKTFYSCNKFHNVLSKCLCNCQ
jgi:hypothetical protein